MHMLENILLRKALATLVFGMAFFLTPRILVETASTDHRAQTIPVRMLEQNDHDAPCLWCEPMTPVDCEIDDSARPPTDPDRLWLNPDEPPPFPQETSPCLERSKDKPTPSA